MQLYQGALHNPEKEGKEKQLQYFLNLQTLGLAKLSVAERDKIQLILFHSQEIIYESYNKKNEQTMKSPTVLNRTCVMRSSSGFMFCNILQN